MNSGIYKITNIKNNKFYIGSTKNITNRKKIHFNLLRRNKNHSKILQYSFNKYGEENFIFEILAKCPVEYLFKLEQWFVDNLKPEYNICIKDVKVPIGLPKPLIYSTKEYKDNKRKEAIQKHITISNFGWKSRKIVKLDFMLRIIKEYNSLKEYAIEHNCSIANVGKALKTKTLCKGFIIRYKNE